MFALNKVILTGRLTRVPELRHTETGMAICNFTIANNKGYGEKQKTIFVNVVTFNKTAENCDRFLFKGSKVAVVGELDIRSYLAKDGQTKYMTEIIANEVEFLSTKNEAEPSNQIDIPDIEDEDLPF